MIQVDRHTIVQILGGLMNHPDLLNETDKYNLTPEDFPNSLDKYAFSAIYNLYADGANKIHAVDVISILNENAAAKNLIEKENGVNFIQDCEVNAEEENFQFYYNKLKKLNLLREIQLTGRDISDIYCENPLSSDYLKINEKFQTMSINDIVNVLKGEVANLENKYSYNNLVEESYAADGVEELIEELKAAPDIGYQLQGDIFNTVCRGGRKGTLYLRSAPSSGGKALPNYMKIPTPNGWTTVGEVKVGDYLFDRFGKPTQVLAVYPQEEKKQVYKVYFKSGRIAECCDEHLWSYYSNCNNKHPNKLITSTLRELIDNPKGLKNKQGQYRWSVPICEPAQYPKKTYSVDPYVMGLILGDGSFRYAESQKAFFFSSADLELVESIKTRMGYRKYKKNSGKNYSWTFESDYDNHINVWVEDILKDYPKLWQTKSETKFIPQDYLLGSVEQRFDLLAGLLDTDGHIDKSCGTISFTTVSPFLRDNIIELCESLGMTCSYSVDRRTEKYTTGECYCVCIKATLEAKTKMFKLSRKKEIAERNLTLEKRREKRDRDPIIKIEATDVYTEMTCFYVDNEEHLFLIDRFCVSHNTRQMVGDACNIAYPIRYDTLQRRWVSTGSCEKVLYIMTEQDTEEIKTMILSYLTGYNEEMFLYGTYGEDEMPRIKIAIDIMDKFKDNMLFARIPDPCSSVVKNLFRKYSIQFGVDIFFYDYIFSSPAMLSEYRDLGLQEHVCLRMFTTTLKNLAVELNAFIMTSTQINAEDDPKGGFRDYRNLEGSKSIRNLVDLGCIFARVTPDELQLISKFVDNFGVKPNIVTDVYKNRRGRWTNVRIWSYYDYGSCRKQDLFMTSATMKDKIEDFTIINFKNLEEKDFTDLLKLYNEGEITDEVYQEYYLPEEDTNKLVDNLKEAFGNREDKQKFYENLDFGDLLS